MSVELRLSFLEECYQNCFFGNTEPTHLIMSRERKEELRGLLLATTPHYVPSPWRIVDGPLGFNNADILGLNGFSQDEIWVANDTNGKPEFNRRFRL